MTKKVIGNSINRWDAYAKVTGKVKFERLGRDKKKVSVYPVEEGSKAE